MTDLNFRNEVIAVEYADETGAVAIARLTSEAAYCRFTDGLDCEGVPWRRVNDRQGRVGTLGGP